MELGAAEEQPSKCQNHHRTKIKTGIGKHNFSIPFYKDFIFGKKKLKNLTLRLATQFDNFEPIY
jgi:hypothetical protein